ncbi:acyl-CoA dehydrogenase family protein [Ammoniphilus sp. 3BR4]|uniref:acyl-CoA dehydrogenase family protein n=1 Tax=Ammoniphilus sp. 3BR4 TaxID=3158265 RepID=UPI003464F8BF
MSTEVIKTKSALNQFIPEVASIPDGWEFPRGLESLISKAKEIGESVLLPDAESNDRERRFPRKSLEALAKAGFGAVTLPPSYGGTGKGYTGFCVLSQILAQYCTSTTMVWVMHTAAVHTLYASGTEEQRQRFIPGVLQGRVGALAFSEPATGSHFWKVVSSAPKTRNGYLLNADKSFVTSAGEADWYVVETRSPETSDPDELMFLLVEDGQEGVQAFPFSALGLNGNSSGPMTFRDVFVPIENRLGKEGGAGWFNDNVIDPLFLLGTSGCWIGVAQGALNAAIDGAKKKVHVDSGSSVAGYQVIRHELAKAQILIDSARSMLYRVAAEMDRFGKAGQPMSDLLYMLWQLKTHSADIVITVTNQALQISGGRGYKTGSVERYLRDGRAGAVMGPTNEILREWIGRTLVGMPWMDA